MLCLELCSGEIYPRTSGACRHAQCARQEHRRRSRQANPERQGMLRSLPSPMSRGKRRDPWPDGPRGQVVRTFQEACLNSWAFPTFARVRPEAALEVLLAGLYRRAAGRSPLWPVGFWIIAAWNTGRKAIHLSTFAGRSFEFLRAAPEHGLSFVLRIVNFATHRYLDDIRRKSGTSSEDETHDGVMIVIDNQPR